MISYNECGEMIGMFATCEDRHNFPVKEAVFPTDVPFAPGKVLLEAELFLAPYVEAGMKHLVVFASGSWLCNLAIYHAARKLRIYSVTFMAYDARNDAYQPVVLASPCNVEMEEAEDVK